MRYLLTIFWCLSISLISNAQLSLSGKYTGENLYFQNPLYEEEDVYCTDSIFVNDVHVQMLLNQGAFEVNLKSMGFSIGDSIRINIYHKTGCKPFLLQSSHSPRKPDALSVKINNNVLTLESRPSNIEEFKVELYRWNKWISIGNLDTLIFFPLDGKTHSGLNLIRVVSIDYDGMIQPSNELKYYENSIKVTCYHSRKKRTLTFSRSTSFELFNSLGEIILSGKNDYIDLSNVKKGRYYLNFDNENITLKIR